MKFLNIFTNILALSSLAATVACNEMKEQSPEIRTISAVIAQPQTRTSLDGPDTEGIYKTVWSSGDEIAVFSGNSEASKFTLKSGENTNSGVFEGYTDSNDLVAVYPLSIGDSRNGTTINVNLPEVQEYVSGNIPQEAYPMLGAYSDETFSFSNLCSVLKVPMTGDVTVKSITFTPNNASVKASGKAAIDMSSTTLDFAQDANSSVRLNCPDVALTSTPTYFHLVVPAQQYSGGFTLTIATDKGDVVKTVKSDVTLSRSVLYPVKAFECKIDEDNNNITFEDANFKAYMVANFDTDNDGEISYEEALAVTKIEVNTDNISSLAGIEFMTNLEHLCCEGSYYWDSSTNKQVVGGTLKSLDISKNTKLSYLRISNNQLTSLNVSNNSKLQKLYCFRNNIYSLDLSKNPDLDVLHCDDNNLSSLDVSNNPKLVSLDCSSNNISSLDVSKNPELDCLDCGGNNISSLDVRNNTKLRILYCGGNNISSLNVSNNPKLADLDCGYNTISSLDISKNQELAFLKCYGNNLSSLDMSKNPELMALYCVHNNISSLDVSNNPKLIDLFCGSNNLTSLDVNNNAELLRFECSSNNISSLDVSKNPRLGYLDCSSNDLSSLDISNNTALTVLYATDNPLATLYIYKGQTDGLTEMKIPSTTSIVVKGSDNPDEPEEPEGWTGKEFWHKSLAMRFTATWCGYCPNLATGFAKAVSQYPNKIEQLNLHPTSSNLGFDGTSTMLNMFKITGFPTGIVDYREIIKNYSSDYAATLIVNAVKETESNYPVKTGISFTSSVSGSTVNLNVKLFIKEKGDYKVTAVLLEDDIIGYQNGGGDSYNHSSIARVAFSDITGDAVSTSEDNKTVSKSYTATIPSTCDKNNLRVLVYVLRQYGSQTIIRSADYGDYYVDNAASAAVGTTLNLVFSDGTVYGGNEDTKDGGEITLE